MTPGIRLLLQAIGLCAAALALDLAAIVVVVVVVSDGPMQAAERAAVGLLAFEALVGLAATVLLWRLGRALATTPRVVATLAFLLSQAAIALLMAFFSLLALNR
jgi:hypothetical protein